MARIKIYTAEYVDKDGSIRYEHEFKALTHKEAEREASHYKIYGLPYPGSGRLKTVIKLTGKL